MRGAVLVLFSAALGSCVSPVVVPVEAPRYQAFMRPVGDHELVLVDTRTGQAWISIHSVGLRQRVWMELVPPTESNTYSEQALMRIEENATTQPASR